LEPALGRSNFYFIANARDCKKCSFLFSIEVAGFDFY